jgi:hypothetical protein
VFGDKNALAYSVTVYFNALKCFTVSACDDAEAGDGATTLGITTFGIMTLGIIKMR